MSTGNGDLVQQAVHAAKAGNAAEARRLLARLTQAEPDNETAWLWLAGVAESSQEALFCLEKVLEINPANDRAAANLTSVRLQAGVAACQSGDKSQGRELLQKVVEQEPGNEQAWLWLAAIADDPDEAIRHLQKVLDINPANERALSGINYYLSLQPRDVPVSNAAWNCILCRAPADRPPPQCPSCKAILHLRDPEMFLANPTLNVAKVKEAVLRLDYALSNPHPETDEYLLHYHLGLAYLNLRQFDEGVTHLRVAVQVGKDTHELRQQLDDLLRLRDQFEASPNSKISDSMLKVPWESLTILVVDTQPPIRKLVSLTMKRSGLKVLEAADGYEMGQVLQMGAIPDMVFLQHEPPGANGYQLCQMLRSNPETQSVPVVLMSTSDGFIHRLRGRWAGCSDFITKPFEPEDLLAMLRKHCEAKLFPGGRPKPSAIYKAQE